MSTDPLYPSQVFFMMPDSGLVAIMLILERFLCAFVRLLT